MLDAKLLEVIACPRCENRPPLKLRDGKLVCEQCQARYPIVNGIPHLLVEAADFPTSSDHASQ